MTRRHLRDAAIVAASSIMRLAVDSRTEQVNLRSGKRLTDL
jgi:hypothetical protein